MYNGPFVQTVGGNWFSRSPNDVESWDSRHITNTATMRHFHQHRQQDPRKHNVMCQNPTDIGPMLGSFQCRALVSNSVRNWLMRGCIDNYIWAFPLSRPQASSCGCVGCGMWPHRDYMWSIYGTEWAPTPGYRECCVCFSSHTWIMAFVSYFISESFVPHIRIKQNGYFTSRCPANLTCKHLTRNTAISRLHAI